MFKHNFLHFVHVLLYDNCILDAAPFVNWNIHYLLKTDIFHTLFLRANRDFLLQLQSGPPLDEMSIACIFRDLLHAIEYLHNEGKIHRDIKGFLASLLEHPYANTAKFPIFSSRFIHFFFFLCSKHFFFHSAFFNSLVMMAWYYNFCSGKHFVDWEWWC